MTINDKEIDNDIGDFKTVPITIENEIIASNSSRDFLEKELADLFGKDRDKEIVISSIIMSADFDIHVKFLAGSQPIISFSVWNGNTVTFNDPIIITGKTIKLIISSLEGTEARVDGTIILKEVRRV